MALAPLCRFSVTPSATHNQIGPLCCYFPRGWVCVHSRPLWVSPMNSLVRLGVSPAATSIPMGVFNQRFEALFPRTGALGCAVCFRSSTIPPGLSVSECGAAGATSSHTACPLCSTICHLSGSGHFAVSPLHPSCPSPPLLLVWMNVSSLSP